MSEKSTPTDATTAAELVTAAKDAASKNDVQAQIFKAISVQRPVVVEYLKSLRRDKPNATPEQLLRELEKRYLATVTTASTGVGASAAIPGVGIPIALGLGVADLLFFYETSALYVLSVAELHGIAVTDAERARPLVFGMLLGKKSQAKVSTLVLTAAGAGGATAAARTGAATAMASKIPGGWGEVLTQQLPDSALAPLTVVMAREALKLSGKLGAGTLGKAVPFGIGAIIGGVGSFTFGKDVVKASRTAFPTAPEAFPEWLNDFAKEKRAPGEQPRAFVAMRAAAGNVADFGEDVWEKVTSAADVFRSVDIDGDGVPDKARARSAVEDAGSAVRDVASQAADAVGSLFRKKKRDDEVETLIVVETSADRDN